MVKRLILFGFINLSKHYLILFMQSQSASVKTKNMTQEEINYIIKEMRRLYGYL